MPLHDSDPYWAARLRMTSQQADELRRKAEQTVREGYHAATRAMGRIGEAAGRVAAPAAEAVDKFKVRVEAELRQLTGREPVEGRPLPLPIGMQVGGATGAMVRGRFDSKAADVIGADKYFHCKANCEASRLGPAGVATGWALSDLRETFDPKNRTDGGRDAAEDHRANRLGRDVGVRRPGLSCSAGCDGLRPKALPKGW